MARFRAGRPRPPVLMRSPGGAGGGDGARPTSLLALLPLGVGAALLVAAELLSLREVRVGGRVIAGSGETAGAHHGYALAILGVAVAALGAIALLRGSRAAAAGALLVTAIAAWIVIGVDHPALDATGLVGAPRQLARAHAGPGWRVEVVGVLLALAGAGSACASVFGRSAARGARGG